MDRSDLNFRILSLDGGGVRGYLSAKILSNIETYLNKRDGVNLPIGKRFDLIAGTSTGGLIALGLAVGKFAHEIVDFYENLIPVIFSKQNRRNIFCRLFDSKYNPGPLRSALGNFFDEKKLQDVVVDVCVVAISLQNGKPRLYKSGYMKRNIGRLDESLVDIGLSTSAAPSYFPSHSGLHSSDLIDGGVCANNPSMIALVEACQFERPSFRNIQNDVKLLADLREKSCLMSIGTGENPAMPFDYKKLTRSGALSWLPVFPFMEIAMQGQSLLAHYQAQFLLEESYLRVNPKLPFPMRLDDVDGFLDLKNLSDIDANIEKYLDTNLI